MKSLRVLAGLALLIAGPSVLQAQATHVTSRDGITGSTLSWFSLFAPAPFSINNTPRQTTVPGLTVTVNAPASAQLLTQKWGSWPGNFAPNDEVLYSANGPIEFVFSDDIFAFGANVQSNVFTDFIGTITAYDMYENQVGSFSANGLSTWNNDGSAIFLGIGAEFGFRRIVMNTNSGGIAMNQAIFGDLTPPELDPPFNQDPPLDDPITSLTSDELPVTTTPEPTSIALMGVGLAVIGAGYRRRKNA